MEKCLNESATAFVGRPADRKLVEAIVKADAKAELRLGKKKDSGGNKWKDKFQGTVERMEEELRRYEDRIQMAENINYLYQQFKTSNIKPILNILHEKYYGIQENFTIDRRSKVDSVNSKETRVIFHLDGEHILNENFLK